MVPGTEINTLYHNIQVTSAKKRDYIVPASKVRMVDTTTLSVHDGLQNFNVNDHALGQIAEFVGVPSRFIDKIRKEAPELITINVNRLMENHAKDRRMVRTLDGTCRAFLSDRYRRLDHEDVAGMVLPVLHDRGFVIRSANVTESKLYIHTISPRVEGEVRVNDPVRFGWIISNSEVGLGALSLQLLVERLVCRNGMVITEHGKRQTHLGRNIIEDGSWGKGIVELSDRTRAAQDRALWSELRDHVSGLTNPGAMQTVLNNLRGAAADEITGDPTEVVNKTAKLVSLQESETKQVLYNYLHAGDHTRWGLANAITALANESENYDRAVALEMAGGQLITMPRSEWATVARAS